MSSPNVFGLLVPPAMDEKNQLMIITGNVLSLDALRAADSFTAVPIPDSAHPRSPRIWYSTNATLRLLSTRTVETALGTVLIARYGVYKEK